MSVYLQVSAVLLTPFLFLGGSLLNGTVNASSVADDIEDDAEDVLEYIDKAVKQGDTQSSPDNSDFGSDSPVGAELDEIASNQTTDSTEVISLKLQLKQHSNEFLANRGYYETGKTLIGFTNNTEICSPKVECEFEVTEGKMRPKLIHFDEFALSGRIKVTAAIDDDASRSRFYDIDSDLKLFKEKLNGSKTIQFLEGELSVDLGAPVGKLDFQITKALLFFGNERRPVLTIEAEAF